MKRLLLSLAGLLLCSAALAAGPAAVRKRVEASMLVTGTIEVAPDGTVQGYTLDRAKDLPPVATDIIGKNIPHWTFQPVLLAGKPVAAKAKMSLRLVAKPIGNGDYTVSVSGAYFGERNTSLKRDMSERPRYPQAALHARVAGTVYLLLRLDRAGKVQDALAEQVNLTAIDSDNGLDHWRQVFATSSLDAARHWTFAPAQASDQATFRIVRVPVVYHLEAWGQTPPDTYGQWQGYVPGPIEPAPWFDADKMLSGGADALPGDGVYDKPSLSLLTPLDRS